jgi:hypothetical protein
MTQPNIITILKETQKMPRLLKLAFERMSPAAQQEFLSAFSAEMEAKEATTQRLADKGIVVKISRPNFAKDTERALSATMRNQKRAE